MDILGSVPGFPGLFVAGVFSGALSTVSGGLNSLTAIALEDFVKLFWRPDLKDEVATKMSKLLAIGFGVFSYLLTFMVKNIPGLVQAWLGIFGIFGGPVLGLFSLGMYVPWASARSALISAVTRFGVSMIIMKRSNQAVYQCHLPALDLDWRQHKSCYWSPRD